MADPVVSPKRAALVRNEVSEDGWGQAQLPDHLQSVRSSHIEHVVRHNLLLHTLCILPSALISVHHTCGIAPSFYCFQIIIYIEPSALYHLQSALYMVA